MQIGKREIEVRFRVCAGRITNIKTAMIRLIGNNK